MSVTAFMSTERSADEIGLSDDMGTPELKVNVRSPSSERNVARTIGHSQVFLLVLGLLTSSRFVKPQRASER
jgi:hypothetical protein